MQTTANSDKHQPPLANPDSSPLLQNQKREPSFAQGMNFYKLFWIFVFCCILGVVVETIFHYIKFGVLHSTKGMIYGPFNQIYGFGGVLIALLFYRFSGKRMIFIFAIGAFMDATFEYVCSLIQESAFGTLSWEYSGSALSIGGRTNFKYAFFWGILSLLFIKYLYPPLSVLIERIPNRHGIIITWILAAFLICDMTISAAAVMRQTSRNEGVPASNIIDEFLDEYYPDEKLEQVYPNMKTASEARIHITSSTSSAA